MKALDPRIDENKLWQMTFPCFYQHAAKEGVYVMPQLNDLLLQLQLDGGGCSAEERAFNRLDLAMACLWPLVKDLFCVDFFPHRLAAATDMLRAADFGEGNNSQVNALAHELAEALNAVETLLSADSDDEQALMAAEDNED